MRINCPYCKERDLREFAYRGDAEQLHAPVDGGTYETLYLRDNPAGVHAELWQHVLGCRAWLRVERDTTSHAILSVTPVRRFLEGQP